VAGQERTLVIEPNRRRDADALDIRGPGFTMRLTGLDTDGTPLPLNREQALVIETQSLAKVEGNGFQPDSPVQVYLLSTPTFLGTVTTTTTGSFEGTVLLPASIQPGRHTLQSNGFTPDGQIRSVSVGVVVVQQVPSGTVTIERARVLFAPLSAELSATARATLAALVERTPGTAQKVVVIGFVQPTSSTENDRSLSTRRAGAVANYLRSLGLKGRYRVRGDGAAREAGATARRVVVTVSLAQVRKLSIALLPLDPAPQRLRPDPDQAADVPPRRDLRPRRISRAALNMQTDRTGPRLIVDLPPN
jgi:outer membrane protein OmpA-like peptidoglycan-associated protein